MGNCCAAPATADAPTEASHKLEPQHNASAAPQAPTLDKAPAGFEATHRAIRLLGRGIAADTWLFSDRTRGQLVAVKLFNRPVAESQLKSITREVLLQAELGPGHENLINVYDLVLTDTHLGLVMEYASGESLTSFVAEKWGLAPPHGLLMSEDEARYLFRQFIMAVDYCHRHFTAHRDLKLDNTLLTNDQPPVLKICDFGFARHFNHLSKSRSKIGTLEYMAPELLKKDEEGGGDAGFYDPREVDVWAAGIMLLVALCGAFPFDHTRHVHYSSDEQLDLWLQEVNAQWSASPFLKERVGALSAPCRDLLDHILTIDPAHRFTITQITEHPWYTQPLLPEYQAAMDRILERQSALDRHVAHRRIDKDKVEARKQKVVALLKAACTIEADKHAAASKSHPMRPLHIVADHNTDEARRIDLTEDAVLEGGTCGCLEQRGAPGGITSATQAADAAAMSKLAANAH